MVIIDSIVAAIKVTSDKQKRLVLDELTRMGYAPSVGQQATPIGFYLHPQVSNRVTHGSEAYCYNILHLKDLKGRDTLEQIN